LVDLLIIKYHYIKQNQIYSTYKGIKKIKNRNTAIIHTGTVKEIKDLP